MTENARSCNMKSCYCRDRLVDPDPAAKRPAATTCVAVQKKFDGAAAWVLGGFMAAFFSSLERCSCINITTKDDLEDDSPLIPLGDVFSPADDVGFTADHGGEVAPPRTVEGNKDVILSE